jgi:hypothetical protein
MSKLAFAKRLSVGFFSMRDSFDTCAKRVKS